MDYTPLRMDASIAALRVQLGLGTDCGTCISYAREVLHEALDSKTVVTELSFRASQLA